MAMTKAEMQAHALEYDARMAVARSAEADGRYAAALEAAMSACDYVDAMMQYECRYGEKEFATVAAIEVVLRYSPLLLDLRSLDRLEDLLRGRKRIERDTAEDISRKLALAKSRLWENHRLWTHLEANPDAWQGELCRRLGGEQEYWRSVAGAWEKMGLLTRRPESGSYFLTLHTRLKEVVRAKCSHCGHIIEAPKVHLLAVITCEKCRTETVFVLRAGSGSTETQE